jgi:osmotically inducible protein OsmC
MPVKSGSAVWTGDLKTGKGKISSESGALKDVAYGFNTRFEGKPGSNPEELIGAAHAACFSMALSNILGGKDIVPDKIETTSKITIVEQDGGPTITKAHLVVRLAAKGDENTLKSAAHEAEKGCPVSKLLNAEITMDLTLG